jgi:hypothetical protein
MVLYIPIYDKITNPKCEKSENEIEELRKRIIHLEILLKKSKLVEAMG